MLHEDRHHAEDDALGGHRADERRQSARAKRQKIQAHRQADQKIEIRIHDITPFQATSRANKRSRNAVVSSSGTRRKAKRASSDSTIPTPIVTINTHPTSNPAAAGGVNCLKGSTACVSSTVKSRSFMDAPCRITASGGPL